EAADVLAPAPKVDEEPSATILIGSPLTRRRAVRGSGRSKRTCSAATTHAGERGSAAGVMIEPAVCARTGSSANKPAVATAPKTAARRKKIWRCMTYVSSLLEVSFLF